jgi:hypothetical protein
LDGSALPVPRNSNDAPDERDAAGADDAGDVVVG